MSPAAARAPMSESRSPGPTMPAHLVPVTVHDRIARLRGVTTREARDAHPLNRTMERVLSRLDELREGRAERR